MRCPVDGLLNVGIVEDDIGGLATKLEGDVLEVGLSSGFHDLATDESATSESNLSNKVKSAVKRSSEFFVTYLLNIVVLADGSTDDMTVTINNVDNARGEASLADELSHEKRGERGKFGWLEDNGVSGSESRADLPGQHHNYEQREQRLK